MISFIRWLEAKTQGDKSYHDQEYSDNDGEWNVGTVLKYIKNNDITIKKIPISDLLKNLEPSEYETADELPGSPDFIARANKSNLKYPLIGVSYPDGIFILDGIHRLWKAKHNGLSSVKVYLIAKKELDKIPHKPKKR